MVHVFYGGVLPNTQMTDIKIDANLTILNDIARLNQSP